MLKHLYYRDRGTFLQSLHPAAILSYLAALLLLPLFLTHPLYLVSILLAGLLAAFIAGAAAGWYAYLTVGLWPALLLLLLNPLLSSNGRTVLFLLPPLPFIGGRTITLEALCYGAVMGLRFLAIITAFALYNTQVHPDRVTGLLSRFAWKSALLVSLATRMIPTLTRELSAAREVQQLRGVGFGTGNLRQRLQKYGWLLELLLVSSLEGSLQTAEAMQARAFGSGPRSSYLRNPVRPRDYLCSCSAMAALLLSIYARVRGYADFTFYPQLGRLVDGASGWFFYSAVMLSILLPLIIGWGWQRWPYLRSKI